MHSGYKQRPVRLITCWKTIQNSRQSYLNVSGWILSSFHRKPFHFEFVLEFVVALDYWSLYSTSVATCASSHIYVSSFFLYSTYIDWSSCCTFWRSYMFGGGWAFCVASGLFITSRAGYLPDRRGLRILEQLLKYQRNSVVVWTSILFLQSEYIITRSSLFNWALTRM